MEPIKIKDAPSPNPGLEIHMDFARAALVGLLQDRKAMEEMGRMAMTIKDTAFDLAAEMSLMAADSMIKAYKKRGWL